MRTIPIIRCTDVKRSLAFYTDVLGFKKKYPEAKDTDWVIDLCEGMRRFNYRSMRAMARSVARSMFASRVWMLFSENILSAAWISQDTRILPASRACGSEVEYSRVLHNRCSRQYLRFGQPSR
jgi:hypothetical protein